MSAEASRAPRLPKQIGKYRVLGRLGEGATSEVFHARDDFHGREVAIKVVRRPDSATHASSDDHFYARFFAAEAALVGRLEHPNLVQIYDAVADPKHPHLVMEYVPGTTLKAFCRADALLSLEQIVEIGFKCAMALGYVARLGLIHRDVKPANLLALMDRDDQLIDVKITDFGSVLQLDADRTQIHRVGSLAYMAPEQLDGATLDARADMYSLAAVLYHLIAGRPPFEGPTQAALMHQIFHEAPAPLARLREGVPESLDALVRRALSKAANDRPDSWDDFAQGLAGVIARREVPRGRVQGVLDSERFTLLRGLEFFNGFGDVELWEVVHRARWQRFSFGHALYKQGQQGRDFHILAAGSVEVFRQGRRVAELGRGTSVGEMAYLAPSEELRSHQSDVIVSQACTTVSFTPDALAQLSPGTRHRFDDAFIKVLVKRLHTAHEALHHPRRIL